MGRTLAGVVAMQPGPSLGHLAVILGELIAILVVGFLLADSVGRKRAGARSRVAVPVGSRLFDWAEDPVTLADLGVRVHTTEPLRFASGGRRSNEARTIARLYAPRSADVVKLPRAFTDALVGSTQDGTIV